ncbi:hypothetical protein [Microbacterium proteolyticum]|uniref:hypothetical protein n=1 Tax=Microbacterium proteolyticum TaxID=1572644 RepID=UPI001FAB857A|nr:hypothetical protein [Microbacterium proteolyticum]MCI9856786.1 hypothetical protein [Microbacterium proteolyticum]
MSEENAPAVQPGRGGCLGCLGCLGVFGILGVIIVVGTIVTGISNPRDACDDAQDAKVLARTLDDPGDRDIAAMQYAVKARECAAIGGEVP